MSTSSRTATGHPYPIRGIIERDSSPSGFALEEAAGFNWIDTGPYRDLLDGLQGAGLKGYVWLGNYRNETCGFENPDAWVRSHLEAVAGHPAIGGYYVADEPDATRCPDAPQQVRARSDLIHSLDPGPPTFVVAYRVPQFRLFAGTTDVLMIDIYPCSRRNGCVYSKIDEAVSEVNRLGVPYWAMIQAHGDGWYRQPTPQELHEEFRHWRASRMAGYFVFSWAWPPHDRNLWLEHHPDLVEALRQENAGRGSSSGA